jgi:phenylalanyl-tRNA synthetase beta chain
MHALFRGADGHVGTIAPVASTTVLRLRNPLQADRDQLRVTLVPSLLESLAENLKHEAGASLFEFGVLFLPQQEAVLPDERPVLSLVIAGRREPFSLHGDEGDMDFFDIKGILQTLFHRVGHREPVFQATERPGFHPGRTACVLLDGSPAAIVGELLPFVATSCGIEGVRVYGAEVDLRSMLAAVASTSVSVPVPRYLPVRQDFAVVVAESTPAGVVQSCLASAGGSLVTSVDLFDVYRGEQIGEGRKSLAFRVTFTAPDRALTDNDLVKVRKRIERQLAKEVNGVLRG